MTEFLRTSSTADLQAAWRDGARALREGRAAEALALFNRITSTGQPTAAVWIGVAMAHRALDDRPAERAALEQALKLDPRDLRALLMMADHYTAVGDPRAAAAYYDTVVKIAVAAGSVEKGLEPEIGRAQRMREQYAAAYEAHLREALGSEALDRPEARRIRRSMDLLLGKSRLYLQQPKAYYFPELPNIEYADRDTFPWLDRLEAATGEIRAELMAVLREDSGFAPYVEADPNRPFFDNHGMLGNPDWSAFYLWKAGAPVPENAARFSATMAALEEAPLCRVTGRTPSILFSLLRPGAHIPPHHGFTNARYICHLPLIVPEGCAMRVGSETRSWTEGRACVFDDSIEHEAWNRNPNQLRVVLIFDVWRPELSEPERELISSMLQAVDAYGAGGEASD
jgi:aspartyl/asparaginyl beta-hydroxylase (cupin superfamily)